ncbi:MAG: helicase-related protein, partial [Polyangiaceae bacterium]
LVGIPCPRCEARLPGGGILRRIESGTDAALQVLIDGLYPQLPEHKDADRRTLRGGGRRALLFADNRQIAAALAAKVEESHDLLLSRVILTEALRSASENATSPEVDRLNARLNQLIAARASKEERDRVLAELDAALHCGGSQGVDFRQLVRAVADHPRLSQVSSYDADRREALATMIVARELGRRPARNGNLEANGIVAVEYTLTLPRPTHPDVAAAFTQESWRGLVEVILDLSRTSGIVALPDIAEPYDRYVIRARHNKLLVKEVPRATVDDDDNENEDDETLVVPLVPGPQRVSRRIEYIGKVLARINPPPTVVPRLILAQVWESLESAARVEGSCLKVEADERVPGLRLPMPRLRFRAAEGGQAWRCPVCRTLWSRHVANVCPTTQCAGLLSGTDGAPLDVRDRLVALAHSTEPLLGMTTEEHTAQIGTDDLESFEQQFKAGELNVLVCSTTMELGIDIGGLSATVLTNVPPGASNYLQRAGRAGRRAEGTSLVLTFARPRPFDQAAFEEPDRPFNDRIVPPRVQLDSRRIVQRHANALLLAHFFRHYGAQADARDPMSSLRSLGEFFDSTVATVLGGSAELAKLVNDAGVVPTEATLSDAFVGWLGLALLDNSELSGALARLVGGTTLEQDDVAAIAQRAGSHMRRISENVRGQLRILRDERAEERGKPVERQDDGRIKALALQEEDLVGEKLLGFLAEEQFLP